MGILFELRACAQASVSHGIQGIIEWLKQKSTTAFFTPHEKKVSEK